MFFLFIFHFTSESLDYSKLLRGILTRWKQADLTLLDHLSLEVASGQMENNWHIILVQQAMHPWECKRTDCQSLKDRSLIVK